MYFCSTTYSLESVSVPLFRPFSVPDLSGPFEVSVAVIPWTPEVFFFSSPDKVSCSSADSC